MKYELSGVKRPARQTYHLKSHQKSLYFVDYTYALNAVIHPITPPAFLVPVLPVNSAAASKIKVIVRKKKTWRILVRQRRYEWFDLPPESATEDLCEATKKMNVTLFVSYIYNGAFGNLLMNHPIKKIPRAEANSSSAPS